MRTSKLQISSQSRRRLSRVGSSASFQIGRERSNPRRDDRIKERDHRPVVFASRLLEQPPYKSQKSDAPDPFWGLAHSVRRVSLERLRRTRSATPLFHIRRRLAWHRFASHARERDAVERPSHYQDDNVCISSGMRNSSYSRTMDTHCRSADCFGRNLADHDDIWRPLGSPPPRNHWRRSCNVRTGLVVGRCSPIWVEARTSSSSQEWFYLTLSATEKHQISCLRRGCCSPHEGLRFVSIWGCPQTALRRIMCSLTGPKGSNSKFKPSGLNKR